MIEVPNDPVVQKPDSALPSTRPPKHTWQGRSVTLQPRQGLGHVARRVASFVKNSLSSLGQRIGNRVIPSRRAGVQLERFFETCKFRYWSEVNPEALTELEHMTNLLLKVDANKAFSKIENVFGKLVQLTRGLNQYGRSEEERARSQPINDQVVNIYLELASSDTAFSWQNKTLGGFLEQLRGENAAFSHETHERIDTFIHNLATREQEVFDRFEAAEQIDSKSRLLVLHTGLITREGEGSSFKRYVHPSILLDMDLDTFTELLTDSFIRESLDSDSTMKAVMPLAPAFTSVLA